MEFSTVDEIARFLREREDVFLYGAGRICELFLKVVAQMDMSYKIRKIFVTNQSGGTGKIMGIPVVEFQSEQVSVNSSIIIMTVKYQQEIEQIIKNKVEGIKEIVNLSPDIKEELRYALQKGQQGQIDQLRETIVETIKLGQEDKQTGDRPDILFISPPYWDVYSPFSAVPCLIASLREKKYIADQIDLGIYCIRHVITKRWKEAAEKCTSEHFYENQVKKYVKNTYVTYEQFKKDMWFFQGENYNITEVKERYQELNAVQRGVIDAFYATIYRMDLSNIDFNKCGDIHSLIEKSITLNYLEVLCSDAVLKKLQLLPKVVGISITSTCQFLPGCVLAKLIKEGNPDVKIIFGGSCADLFAKSNYRNKEDIRQYFDYFIVGEGETALYGLLEHMKGGQDLKSIPNLMLFENGKMRYTEQIVEDVLRLPPPDYDGLDLELYLAPRLILPYQTSRGCHYGQCAFCNHDEKYRHNYRSKQMKKVVEELVFLSQKYHTRYFQFVDEAIRPDCFAEMVEEMDKHAECKNLKWIYYSRVSRRYNEELLVKARRNGCEMVMFGVETFNQRLLNFIKKGISADTSRYCLELFHRCGIKTYAWLMCNLPSESIEEVWEDYEEVSRQMENIDAFSVGPFSLVENTDMYHNPSKYNITYIDPNDSLRFSSHHDNIEINKDQMLRFYWDEYHELQNKWCFKGNRYTLFLA